ncbi:MAG: hypothetical protein LBM65_07600 [Oscillospiraceae bacterium]|jgi:hypothetical protein|nr:hypothetical protein [Oscillospiraceae bacterium]
MTETLILDTVLNQLLEDFSEIEYRYLEKQTQNINKPCFMVKQLLLQQERLLQGNLGLGDKYKHTYRLSISYYPNLAEQRPIRDCENIAKRLLCSFKKLRLPEFPAWCKNCEYEVTDEQLQFRFDVTIYAVLTDNTAPPMQTMGLDETIIIKEE